MLSDLRFFAKSEYACKCGRPTCEAPLELHPDLARGLDLLRESIGIPLVLTSGLRCRAHNAAVGGAPDSRHLTGRAADIACDTDDFRDELVSHILIRPVRLFPTLELAPKHLHVDVDLRVGGRPRLMLGTG